MHNIYTHTHNYVYIYVYIQYILKTKILNMFKVERTKAHIKNDDGKN